MIVSARIPLLIDRLTALFGSSPTLGLATPRVAVYDGPVVTADPESLVLWVGLPDPAIPAEGAHFEQTWDGMGHRSSGMVTIHCCAVAWGGGESVSTQRAAVFGIVAAAEALVLAADPVLWAADVRHPSPGVISGALTQSSTDRGVAARVTFDLIFQG